MTDETKVTTLPEDAVEATLAQRLENAADQMEKAAESAKTRKAEQEKLLRQASVAERETDKQKSEAEKAAKDVADRKMAALSYTESYRQKLKEEKLKRMNARKKRPTAEEEAEKERQKEERRLRIEAMIAEEKAAIAARNAQADAMLQSLTKDAPKEEAPAEAPVSAPVAGTPAAPATAEVPAVKDVPATAAETAPAVKEAPAVATAPAEEVPETPAPRRIDLTSPFRTAAEESVPVAENTPVTLPLTEEKKPVVTADVFTVDLSDITVDGAAAAPAEEKPATVSTTNEDGITVTVEATGETPDAPADDAQTQAAYQDYLNRRADYYNNRMYIDALAEEYASTLRTIENEKRLQEKESREAQLKLLREKQEAEQKLEKEKHEAEERQMQLQREMLSVLTGHNEATLAALQEFRDKELANAEAKQKTVQNFLRDCLEQYTAAQSQPRTIQVQGLQFGTPAQIPAPMPYEVPVTAAAETDVPPECENLLVDVPFEDAWMEADTDPSQFAVLPENADAMTKKEAAAFLKEKKKENSEMHREICDLHRQAKSAVGEDATDLSYRQLALQRRIVENLCTSLVLARMKKLGGKKAGVRDALSLAIHDYNGMVSAAEKKTGEPLTRISRSLSSSVVKEKPYEAPKRIVRRSDLLAEEAAGTTVLETPLPDVDAVPPTTPDNAEPVEKVFTKTSQPR